MPSINIGVRSIRRVNYSLLFTVPLIWLRHKDIAIGRNR
jgi:hypothetical protein